jgi:hypothetical protein
MNTNKTLIILIVQLLLCTSILSLTTTQATTPTITPTVTLTEATRIADQHLLHAGKTTSTLTAVHTILNHDTTLGYVYTLDPTGYIVVPASRYLPPVIAYSWTSDFGTYTTTNPLYTMLCTDLNLRIACMTTLPPTQLAVHAAEWTDFLTTPQPSQSFEQWPPEGSTPTGGWVFTLWTQDAPYNNMCPVINSQRSLAGCPAVAMSQIVAYFNTTKHVQFTDSDDYHHNYGGANFWIDNDHVTYQFPSWPELNGYLDIVEDHWATGVSLTDQDKAAINVACGFAMQQVYNPSGSGTFGVQQAYDAYQRFGFTTSILFNGESAEMFQHLSANMKHAIPAHIAVVNQDWTVGHNMVVDGYNTDDYYHINFGWGGSYNGWYHIPDDLPFSLTVVEGVITDIMPTPNLPPGPINGPIQGITNTTYTYWISNEERQCQFNWDDGTISDWDSNATSHLWTSPGMFQVQARAKDSYGSISNWSTPLYVTITASMPALRLSFTQGGFGVSAKIENTGTATATQISWTMNVTGGVLNRIHTQRTGTVDTLDAKTATFIKAGGFLGLGPITIELKATCAQGVTATKTAQGTIILCWVKLT